MKQRYRIYSAEGSLHAFYTTLEGMQAWLNWVVKTKWWKDKSKIKHVEATFPSVGKMSGAVKVGPHLARIDFGAFSLDQLTGCHELGHILTWDEEADQEEDHGPRFAATYLQVVRRYIGADFARELAKEFDEGGVKYSTWE